MSAPHRVFLTGATGFIGGRLARALAARGDALRCLVRSPDGAGPLADLGAELVAGEITDSIALARGLQNADLVIHLAGVYDLGPRDVRELERVNVAGTRCVLEEAIKARTPRIIHVSTTIALGPTTHGTPNEVASHPSVYHRTKTEAHHVVRQAQARGVPAIIVCPANVYGPGDEGPNGRFIRDLLRGRLPALLSEPATFSYVHVDDVVAGIMAAADRGEVGACYVLGGEVATLNRFAEEVAARAGRSAPRLRLPVWMVRATGMALDLVSVVTRRRFSISRESVDATARLNWAPDDAETRHALGLDPRPLAEGLRDTVAWFVENG